MDEAASGRVPQPGPSRPDGSYTPHGLRDGSAPARPIDLAAWKQQDYAQMEHAQEVARHIPPSDVPTLLDLARWKEEDYSHMKAYNQHPVHPAFKIVTGLLMISAGAFPLTLGALVWGIVVAEHGVGTATGVGEIIALADTPELLGLGGLLIGAGLELIWRGGKIVSSGLHELREGKK